MLCWIFLNREKGWTETSLALVASLFSSRPSLRISVYGERFFFCTLLMAGSCKFCGCGKLYSKGKMKVTRRILRQYKIRLYSRQKTNFSLAH